MPKRQAPKRRRHARSKERRWTNGKWSLRYDWLDDPFCIMPFERLNRQLYVTEIDPDGHDAYTFLVGDVQFAGPGLYIGFAYPECGGEIANEYATLEEAKRGVEELLDIDSYAKRGRG